MPFGIDPAQLDQYAVDKLTRRLESIRSARGRPPAETDTDYMPIELEERFADEDARAPSSDSPQPRQTRRGSADVR